MLAITCGFQKHHVFEQISLKEMKAENALEGIEGNVGDVSKKIDLVMAAKT